MSRPWWGHGSEASSPPEEGTFSLLASPQQALAWRCELLRSARHTIDAQYYSWEEDASGKLLLAELLAAARRGVKVRLLIDHLYSDEARFLPLLAHHHHIELRRFNPFQSRLWHPLALLLEVLLRFRHLNHRMHNKLLLVDGRQAIMGGRNIGDSYFGLSDSPAFVDLDIACRGALCRQLVRGFERFWRSRWSHPWHPSDLDTESAARLAFLGDYLQPGVASLYGIPAPLVAEPLPWWTGKGSVLFDVPGKGVIRQGRIARLIGHELARPHARLTLVSPYLVLPPPFMRRLLRLARRGVSITLLTNALETTDVPLVHGAYERQRARLRRHGIRVCELREGQGRSLHAKLVLGEPGLLLLGSFNLDPRSLYLNTEIALRIDCPPLQQELDNWCTTWLAESDDEEHSSPPGRWQRCWLWLVGRLPIQRWL
ncbi:phospholipase D family protein [Aeromonas schubertii]|uniref:phospholipase D family protein n=1 Tax=Aeromonas schubertii TaxID=652 RepID=UPI001CC75A09|nr:phospholipase D family protein [Aeromonas schubertii]MBZ6072759.1 phospholipase D family protein [Aeromonas schubertii]